MIRIITTAILAASVFGLAPASAQDAPTAKVGYADLDLTSAAGQKTLARRLSGAINHVCENPGHADLATVMAWKQCRTVARISAHTEMAAAIDRSIRLAAKSSTEQLASR
jgi:UrcA family protein